MNLKYLETFVVSGLTVTGISYFGNSVNPALGGILSGIPISIPAMLTIASVSNQKDFILHASIMVALLTFVTFLCWYVYTKWNWKNTHAVGFSMVIWFIGAFLYYFFDIKQKQG